LGQNVLSGSKCPFSFKIKLIIKIEDIKQHSKIENLMPIRGVKPWENLQFSQGGMLKFIYKGWFLTIKIAYEKFLDWKSKQCKHALVPLLR
jgi:hypothetical protein